MSRVMSPLLIAVTLCLQSGCVFLSQINGPNHVSFLYHSGDALPKVQCPNHPDALLVEDYRAGDMICPECGLVVGTYLESIT